MDSLRRRKKQQPAATAAAVVLCLICIAVFAADSSFAADPFAFFDLEVSYITVSPLGTPQQHNYKVEEVPGKKDTVDNGQTSSENSTKLGERKINKKNLDAEEKIQETKDENSSLQEANTGKVEQTTEKKKSKEKKNDDEPSQVRTFPNGLVIEEIEMGRPDGKKADRGKKVSVRYVGKLKKNGKIFDSNIGMAPFKFRLGIGQVIKGFDVGVSGMRVGDKRRLTIPPSMGYGAAGAPPTIPPNAWLVFDVKLVDVA